MDQTRRQLIQQLFENTEAAKRGMYGHLQAYMRNLPIARAPLEVLTAVKHLQPVSSKEIAAQLFLTAGAVSQSVEILDAQGYVIREASREDRRIQRLKLSKKGEKLLAEVEKRRRNMMEEITKDLTLEELTMWLTIQSKMAARLGTISSATKQSTKDNSEAA